jgi:hypothetical protein
MFNGLRLEYWLSGTRADDDIISGRSGEYFLQSFSELSTQRMSINSWIVREGLDV